MKVTYKRIGLLDHMGYGNMGDAAIQESFITNIRQRLPEAVIIGFSLNPEDTRARHGIESYPIRWYFPGWDLSKPSEDEVPKTTSGLKACLRSYPPLYAWAKAVYDATRELVHLGRSYRLVKSLDLLVMSGGGQLCELWKDLPYNVFKFCVLAKLAGAPVFIVGVGADLLERPLNKFFAKWSVRLADYTSFRSAESQDRIQQLGVRKATYVCPDPAYALDLRAYVTTGKPGPPAGARQVLHSYVNSDSDIRRDSTANRKRVGRPKVGLNPMGFCDPRRWMKESDSAYSLYLDKMQAFSSWLLGRGYDVEIFTSDYSGDIYAIEDLKHRVPPDAPRMVYRPVASVDELLGRMSTFDYVVTPKFHGVVFCHMLGKPVIALSYMPKIDNLMRTVGHSEYCLDIERFSVQWLIQTFESLVDDKDRLEDLFRRTSAAYAEALRKHFDDLFGVINPQYCGADVGNVNQTVSCVGQRIDDGLRV